MLNGRHVSQNPPVQLKTITEITMAQRASTATIIFSISSFIAQLVLDTVE